MNEPRWFFALSPQGLREHPEVLRVLSRLRKSADEQEWDVKWTPKIQLHVTVGFVGPVNPEQSLALKNIGARVAALAKRTQLELKDVSAFPELEAGRVVWVGVRRTRELVELHAALGAELAAAGFSPDTQEFTPHVTLGRLRHARHLGNWLSPFRRKDFGDVAADRLELFTSQTFGPRVVYKSESQWVLV
jgi:RNA 2',3'-cyclic 3'-phosphodiesterase